MAGKRKSSFPRLAKSESKPKRRRSARAKKPGDVYVVRLELLGTKPPIWRRFAVPANITLAKLHDVIQVVMGWYDCHLHQFVTRDHRRFGSHDPDIDLEWEEGVVDERKVRLCEVVDRPKQRFVYEYDFGDGWEHGLELEKIATPEPGVRYPVCLGGKRACPPEDCGGIWGYAEFVQAIRDPKHEQHDELLEWIGGEFDPEAFDIEAVNELLRTIR